MKDEIKDRDYWGDVDAGSEEAASRAGVMVLRTEVRTEGAACHQLQTSFVLQAARPLHKA